MTGQITPVPSLLPLSLMPLSSRPHPRMRAFLSQASRCVALPYFILHGLFLWPYLRRPPPATLVSRGREYSDGFSHHTYINPPPPHGSKLQSVRSQQPHHFMYSRSTGRRLHSVQNLAPLATAFALVLSVKHHTSGRQLLMPDSCKCSPLSCNHQSPFSATPLSITLSARTFALPLSATTTQSQAPGVPTAAHVYPTKVPHPRPRTACTRGTCEALNQ